MTIRTILAASLIVAGTAGAAMAQPAFGPGFGGHGHWHGSAGALLDGVTLSDAQKSKVAAIVKQEHDATAAQRKQLHGLHDQIENALLGSEPVSAAQLAPLQQQEAGLMQQLASAHLSAQLSIRDVLTPAQLSQAAQIHAKLVSLHEQARALHEQGSGGTPAAQ
ncbi:Spy/CpxP family protein refolding chaperone [Rhizosaccharibacter radicis]|uniref:Spy/CpxP family protein refolding chaperone n=1 Tax=Rhizosaccharibacter radicis TaxID=2782605 RepID=A0ABT1VTN3_9PROT|nr:Spy/CpxP family protein refolding chaperone [Acetobacteraceae bacterium KSS12]